MPGHAKIVSVITAPVSTAPNWRPTIVTTGIRLLRKACAMTARHARDAARPRGLHVWLAQLFEQRRPRHPREHRGERESQRQRRQHEMLDAAAARHRQPAELHGEDDRQQRARARSSESTSRPAPPSSRRDRRPCRATPRRRCPSGSASASATSIAASASSNVAGRRSAICARHRRAGAQRRPEIAA